MKKIEEGLHAYHANLAPAHTAAAAAAPAAARQVETPFAKIHHLAANSPAAEAGLLPGDHIKQFGPVNALNHDGLRKLAEVVAQSEGVRYHTRAIGATNKLIRCFRRNRYRSSSRARLPARPTRSTTASPSCPGHGPARASWAATSSRYDGLLRAETRPPDDAPP